MEIQSLRKQILEQKFGRLNEQQRQAVFTANGPVLILAGAGSGKTTVLVQRVAYLIRYGNAYFSDHIPDYTEDELSLLTKAAKGQPCDEGEVDRLLADRPVFPWHILAITFTNKAANEMKDRLEQILGPDAANEVTAGTFHSCCVRILRCEIELLGYKSNFTIYDTDDSVRVMKQCMRDQNIDDKLFPPKSVLTSISHAKDSMISPQAYKNETGDDYRKSVIAILYNAYQKRLMQANAVDFDDLIRLTVELFTKFPDRLAYYQNRYRYLLVDEYQDTNHAQYRLVSLLAAERKNICVVGDDDQSIYRFRGATIENILSFEEQFAGAKVIRLEQNYRSTQPILDAANRVIANNLGRKGKELWTDRKKGDKIYCYRGKSERDEADFIAETVLKDVAAGGKFGDHAVLYRMNAQSQSIEQRFLRSGIPYRVFGGTKFFDRKEIRDIISYLTVLQNPSDAVRLTRIINEPKRGIGDTTVQKAVSIASGTEQSVYEVLQSADAYPTLERSAGKLKAFTDLIERLRVQVGNLTLDKLLDEVMRESGYEKMLLAQGEEGAMRLENIAELKSALLKYGEENDPTDLAGYLEEVALYTDLDTMNQAEDCVVLMTLHSAKGLEFPIVFIAGMEENIFPSSRNLKNAAELEEERRLAYVGITRAKQKLYLLSAAERMLYGSVSRNPVSRFVEEIPIELRDMEDAAFSLRTHQKPMRTFPPRRGTASGRTVGMAAKSAEQTESLSYTIGDRVVHRAFGVGTVLSMTKMGNDTLVEIDFDGIGKKKIMANFARLQKE